MIALNIIYFS